MLQAVPGRRPSRRIVVRTALWSSTRIWSKVTPLETNIDMLVDCLEWFGVTWRNRGEDPPEKWNPAAPVSMRSPAFLPGGRVRTDNWFRGPSG
jgi:hypothetical protein